MVDESSLENYKEGMELTSKQLTAFLKNLTSKRLTQREKFLIQTFMKR